MLLLCYYYYYITFALYGWYDFSILGSDYYNSSNFSLKA